MTKGIKRKVWESHKEKESERGRRCEKAVKNRH